MVQRLTFLVTALLVTASPLRADEPPGSEETTAYETRAAEVTQLIESGEFDKVEKVFADLVAARTITRGGYPAASSTLRQLFSSEKPDPRAQQLDEKLNAWVTNKPKSAIAHAVRGASEYHKAWLIRGIKFSSKTPDDVWAPFREGAMRAEADLQKAVELDRQSFLPYGPLIDAMRSRGAGNAEIETVFQEGRRRAPWSLVVPQARALTLDPRWGGSFTALEQFIAEMKKTAPAAMPVSFLEFEYVLGFCNADQSTREDCLNAPEHWQRMSSAIEPLIARYPHAGFYAAQLAKAANQAHRWDDAGRYYIIAADREPKSRDIQYMTGWWYGNKSNAADAQDRALTHYQRAHEVDPNDGDSLYGIGVTYLKRQDNASAIRYLELGAKVAPSDPAIFRKLGQAYSATGANPQAAAAFSRALQLDPKDAPTLTRRAYSYLLVGDMEKTIADCEASLQIKPDAYTSQLLAQAKSRR